MKLDLPIVAVVFLAMFGLTFVLDVWSEDFSSDWIGYAFILMTTVSIAIRLYIYEWATVERSPAALGAETFIVAILFLLTLLFWKQPVLPETMEGYGWSILCGVTLAIGTVCTFFGVSKIGSFRWSLLTKAEPLFATLFAVLLIDEYLETSQYVGMIMVISSLVAYQLLSFYKAKKEEEAKEIVASET